MFLKEAFAEAREASVRPRDFFGRKPEAESWVAPAKRLAFWAFVAGLLDSLVVGMGVSDRPGGVLLNILTPVLFPFFGLAAGAVATLLLHAAWKVMGGKAVLAASWRIAAAVSFTMPLDVLTGELGVMSLLPAALRYWLLAVAAREVHGLARWKAWTVTGALGLLHVVAVAMF
ncbi:hypothetical protein EPO15_07465 [bacterium]|nr:MAG: hypothetical protein EPO15_07465 [bacterium]